MPLEASLDIQSAIDYFLFQDVILGIDGLSNNMLCLTYDMQKWYLSAYDLDSTFGLYATGDLNGKSTDVMPTSYLNQNSALLASLTENYSNEMKARYAELRKNELSYFFTSFCLEARKCKKMDSPLQPPSRKDAAMLAP